MKLNKKILSQIFAHRAKIDPLHTRQNILFLTFSIFLLLMNPSGILADNSTTITNIPPTPHPVKLISPTMKLSTKDKQIALTFDACGGKYGSGYDKELIDFLVENNIPATLFLTGSWIRANPAIAKQLADIDIFDIENHGLRHKPGTTAGEIIYNIRGCTNVDDLTIEILSNERIIENMTGKRPRYYRSGTAYYDEDGLALIKKLGYKAGGFSLAAGDYSGTISENSIFRNIMKATNGTILLLHMNHPDWNTFEALRRAVPLLKEKGYRFVHLDPVL